MRGGGRGKVGGGRVRDGRGASSVRRKRGHSKWMMFKSAGALKEGRLVILPGGVTTLEGAKT